MTACERSALLLAAALAGCQDSSTPASGDGGDARRSAPDARAGDTAPTPAPGQDAAPAPGADAAPAPSADAAPAPGHDAASAPSQDAAPVPDAHVPFACQYGERVEVGTVTATDDSGQPRLTEASGLMQSRLNRDVFWAHNDNGSDHHLFALNRDGRYLATFELDLASASDIEALGMGPGPVAGRNYLYLGDVGANWRIWGCTTPNVDTGDCTGCPNLPARCGGVCDCRGRELRVFRTVEPPVAPGQAFVEVLGVPVETFTLRFPDSMAGQRQDVEGMMVDPRGGDLYLVTKHTSPALLLRAAAPLSTAEPNLLEPVAELPWGGENQATAADISADGWLVGVRRYGDVHVWARAPGATVAGAVQGEGCRVEAGEIQGESFAFDVDGSGSFYSLSESAGQATVPLYLYPRE